MRNLEEVQDRWVLIEAGVGTTTSPYPAYHQAVRVPSISGMGRPRVMIEKEKIDFLREFKFPWADIATIFGVCRRTLYNVRAEYGMLEDSPFISISDEDLREHIRRIKHVMPV